jgi:anti-sigma regulatory factor (Ser/Thr protein kinase)
MTLDAPSRELAIDLPATPVAPALARRAVEQLELDEAVISTACLLTSEIVTNAVRHAANTRPTIRVEAAIRDRRLRLCVTDGGAGFVRPAQPRPRGGEDGGFGLFLVEQLACRWGVADSTVWFELPAAAS